MSAADDAAAASKIVDLAAHRASQATDTTLKFGGGDGTSGGMEARVKSLEDKFEKMDGKLDTIIKDVSYLKGKVEGLPTTLQLLGFVLAVLAIAGLAKYFAP